MFGGIAQHSGGEAASGGKVFASAGVVAVAGGAAAVSSRTAASESPTVMPGRLAASRAPGGVAMSSSTTWQPGWAEQKATAWRHHGNFGD